MNKNKETCKFLEYI